MSSLVSVLLLIAIAAALIWLLNGRSFQLITESKPSAKPARPAPTNVVTITTTTKPVVVAPTVAPVVAPAKVAPVVTGADTPAKVQLKAAYDISSDDGKKASTLQKRSAQRRRW